MKRKQVGPTLAIGTLLAVGGVTALDQRQAAAASATCAPDRATPTSIQHNIQGFTHNHNGRLEQIEPLVDYYALCFPDYPIVITLDEVCTNQFNSLVNYFTPDGYSTIFKQTKPTDSCPGSNYAGIVVMTRSPGGSYVSGYPQGTYSSQDPSDNEPRGYVCEERKINGTPKYVACSTHLDNSIYAFPQANQFDSFIGGERYGHYRPYANGDFNILPERLRIDTPWYGAAYEEADVFPGAATEVGTQNKIDYAFVDHPVSRPHNAQVIPQVRSDHDILASFIGPG